MEIKASNMLGPLQAEYKVHAAKNRSNLLFGRLFVALGPLLLVYSLYRVVAASGDGQPDSLGILCGGTGLLLLLMGVYALWEQGRDKSVSVQVHGDGLVYARGDKVDVLRWDEIEAARMSMTAIRMRRHGKQLDMVYGYSITRQNGPEVKFRFNKNSIPEIDALSDRIQQEVTRRKLPQAMATLQAGGAVQFGRLSVDSQGIGNGKERVPWSEVQEVKVQRGTITVRKKGKWLNWTDAPVGDTPNVFVFLALVDGVIKERPDVVQAVRV